MDIELRHVTKRYGAVTAIHDINLSLGPAASIALIGPNGSGKSTLMRALMGMLRTEGSIRLDGQDPYRDRNRIAGLMAYVPQAMPQFNFTVGEMVTAMRLIRGLAPGEIEICAKRLRLDLFAILGKPVRDLSGGMKQKLMLALALAPRTRLLVLDEPTASLDGESRERFYDLLSERKQDATLILSSHRLEEIRQLVTQVVVLENGEIRHRGAVDEFFSRAGAILTTEERDHAAA